LPQQLHEVQYDEGTTENVDLTSPSADPEDVANQDATVEADGDAATTAASPSKEARMTTANMLLRGEQKVVWRIVEVEAEHAALSDSGSDEEGASDADIGAANADSADIDDAVGSLGASAAARGTGRLLNRQRQSSLSDSDSDAEEAVTKVAAGGAAESPALEVRAGTAREPFRTCNGAALANFCPFHVFMPQGASSATKRKSVLDDSDDSDAEAARDPTPVKRKKRVVLDSDSDDE
jgi:hypothetical protein